MPLCQRVPLAELNSLSCILGSVPSGQLQLSTKGASPSLLRVLPDNRDDGWQFILSHYFTEEIIFNCYRQPNHEVLGTMEVTTMLDYLMLRLKGALQEPWLEDATELRRCVAAGRVSFNALRVKSLLSWFRCSNLWRIRSDILALATLKQRLIWLVLQLLWLFFRFVFPLVLYWWGVSRLFVIVVWSCIVYFRCEVQTAKCIAIIRTYCAWDSWFMCWIYVSARRLVVVCQHLWG